MSKAKYTLRCKLRGYTRAWSNHSRIAATTAYCSLRSGNNRSRRFEVHVSTESDGTLEPREPLEIAREFL